MEKEIIAKEYVNKDNKQTIEVLGHTIIFDKLADVKTMLDRIEEVIGKDYGCLRIIVDNSRLLE